MPFHQRTWAVKAGLPGQCVSPDIQVRGNSWGPLSPSVEASCNYCGNKLSSLPENESPPVSAKAEIKVSDLCSCINKTSVFFPSCYCCSEFQHIWHELWATFFQLPHWQVRAMKFAPTDIQETTLWQKGTAASPPSARPPQGWGREGALWAAASRADMVQDQLPSIPLNQVNLSCSWMLPLHCNSPELRHTWNQARVTVNKLRALATTPSEVIYGTPLSDIWVSTDVLYPSKHSYTFRDTNYSSIQSKDLKNPWWCRKEEEIGYA